MSMQMHAAELADFRATCQTLPVQTRLQYLIRMWTVKEAYTKAIGTGLGTEFRELRIQRLPSDFQGKGCSRSMKFNSNVRISSDSRPSLATSTLAAHARVAIHQSIIDPTLTSTADAEWTIKHGHITVSHSNMGYRTPNGGQSSSSKEQRFAWSLATACRAENLPISIEFNITDLQNLEALGGD